MLEFLTSAITQDRDKRHKIWKETSKAIFIHNDMTVYVENSNELKRKLVELVSEFNNVTVYKIN